MQNCNQSSNPNNSNTDSKPEQIPHLARKSATLHNFAHIHTDSLNSPTLSHNPVTAQAYKSHREQSQRLYLGGANLLRVLHANQVERSRHRENVSCPYESSRQFSRRLRKSDPMPICNAIMSLYEVFRVRVSFGFGVWAAKQWLRRFVLNEKSACGHLGQWCTCGRFEFRRFLG